MIIYDNTMNKRKSCDGLDTLAVDSLRIGKSRLNSTATELRNLALPNKSGTIATTSDISSSIATALVDVVTTNTTQTIDAVKTFSKNVTLPCVNSGLLVGNGGSYGTGTRIGNLSQGIVTIPFNLAAEESRSLSITGLNIPGGGLRNFLGMIICPDGGTNAWDRVIVSLAPNGYPNGNPGTLKFQLANTSNAATSGEAGLFWFSTTQATGGV